MSQPPNLKPIAQALCDAATLPGLTPRDVDKCESSRLKFICYAIAARLHDDPWPLVELLLGVVDRDELARLADEAREDQ